MFEGRKERIPFGQHIPRFPGFIDPVSNQRISTEAIGLGMPSARTSISFRPQIIGVEGAELSKVQRLNFFASAWEAPVASSTDYLDQQELDREVAEIRRQQREIWNFENQKQGNAALPPQVFRTYDGLEERRLRAALLMRELNEDTGSLLEFSVQQILRMGAAYAHHNIVTRLLRFQQDHGFSSSDEFYILEDWVQSGITMVSIGGVTPNQFIDERASVRPPLIDVFRFLVEGHLIREDKKYEQSLVETEGQMFRRYPNKAKNFIEVAAGAVVYSVEIPVETLERSIHPVWRGDRAVTEATNWGKRFIERAREVRKMANQVLKDPNSPEFKELKHEINGYFVQGRFAELRVLNVLGVRDPSEAKNLYRRAKELAGIYPEHTAFYIDLADATRDFQIEVPSALGMLTSDDIPMLLDEESAAVDQVIGVTDIGRDVNQIHPSAYKDSFPVNPDSVSWGALVKPASIVVVFDKNKQKNFKIKLIYQSPEGETTIVEGEFKTQKGNQTFDLNFLEDASEIPEMYQAVLQVTQEALLDVKRQVEDRRAGKTKALVELPHEPKPLVQVKSTKGEKPLHEAKTKVKTRLEELVVVEEEEEEIVVEPGGSQLLMDELSQKRLEKQLERVSFENRDNIYETMERFNNGESVRFYPLKLRGPHGEVLFALRAKATVRGGSRILVTPIRGTADFAVLGAGYRKDIYRDWGIE